MKQKLAHLSALRAAAGVALFGGLLACGTAEVTDLDPQQPIHGAEADAGAPVDAGAPDAALADAGSPDSGLLADAGMICANAADWVACCDAIGWDWTQGCQAWGPPAPPAFPEVA